MRKDLQHYKRTLHMELAMTDSISRMLKSLPNILAITGGVSSRQKEGKEKHNSEPYEHMALSPMTLSQPQCSAVHSLATFSHVNKCKKTTALDRAHFGVFVRIRRHMEEASAAMLECSDCILVTCLVSFVCPLPLPLLSTLCPQH
jgi:hypothetical protein